MQTPTRPAHGGYPGHLPSLHSARPTALDAQSVHDGLATGSVGAHEYDSITTFCNFEDAANALASGAWGSHLDKVGPAHRVVGFAVPREQVQAALAVLVELQARIGRLNHRDHQGAVIHQRVEDEQAGHSPGPGHERADDAHDETPPFVYRSSSVLHEPGRMWAVPGTAVVVQIDEQQKAGANKPSPGEPSALATAGQQAAQARTAALALLAELEHAHALIPLLLEALRPAGLVRFAKVLAKAGASTTAVIRHQERAAALELAHRSTLARQGAHHD